MSTLESAGRCDMRGFCDAACNQAATLPSSDLMCRKVIVIVCKHPHVYTLVHIRPMAVSPLYHPEGVPNPWGFSFSGSAKPGLRSINEAQAS
jgi:hypothetical protein